MVFRLIFWRKSSITAHSVPKSFSTSKNSNPTNPNTMACGSLDKNWNNISAKLVWKCSAGNAITLPIVKSRIMKLYPCIMLMPSNVILAKWSSQVRNFGLFFKHIGLIACFLSQSGIYVVFLPFGQFFTIFKDFC